jgi:UDP-N-acetylglucosamine--N-acetylmuramyl-(pentapeptide) pyrophosphoryl-undecaprenol N-acetylglucosamine transferase
VLGGSQGAAALNRIVPEALKSVSGPLEIRHQAGRGKAEGVIEAYRGRAGASVEEFIMDMAEAYSWAQIVVARAGALTLAELEGAGRPAILIPFPYAAANHQEANAKAYEARGCGVCVVERDLTAQGLAELISGWIADPSVPDGIAARAAESARREAAKTIVDDLLLSSGGRH